MRKKTTLIYQVKLRWAAIDPCILYYFILQGSLSYDIYFYNTALLFFLILVAFQYVVF